MTNRSRGKQRLPRSFGLFHLCPRDSEKKGKKSERRREAVSILLSLFVLSLGGLETRDSHGELLAKKAPCSPFAPLVLSFYSPSFFWRRRSSWPPYPPSSNAQPREGGRGVRRVGIANHDSTIQKMVQGKRRGRRRNERRGGGREDKNFFWGMCMHKCFWPRSLHRLLSDELAGSVALLLFAINTNPPLTLT